MRELAMKVEQIMNRNVKVCSPQDSLNKAAQVMWEDYVRGHISGRR